MLRIIVPKTTRRETIVTAKSATTKCSVMTPNANLTDIEEA